MKPTVSSRGTRAALAAGFLLAFSSVCSSPRTRPPPPHAPQVSRGSASGSGSPCATTNTGHDPQLLKPLPPRRQAGRRAGGRSQPRNHSRSCSRASSVDKPLPLSLLDLPPPTSASPAPSSAMKDNNTTGRFMNQQFTLDVIEDADPDKLIEDVRAKVDAGAHFVMADAAPGTLLKIADALAGKPERSFNYGAPDDGCARKTAAPM